MLPREAIWLGKALRDLSPADLSPMCNVGSNTRFFRETKQPHIHAEIFRPLQDDGVEVVHVDIQDDEGVDVVGDLGEPTFRAQLSARQFRSVFCSNLLEHLEERETLCHAMGEVLHSGGYLFLSVPHSFPYHPDPIDTRFRPDPEELMALFPGTEIVASEVLDCGSLWDNREHLQLPRKVLRSLVPFIRPRGWLSTVLFWPYLLKPFLVTCLVLRKP